MAIIYVRSTDGNDSDNGSTWALAKATINGADAIDAAGDTIWISQSHSETTASMLIVSLANTLAAPGKILCGNDAAEPPTSLATGAVIATTGANLLSFNTGPGAYVYGIEFRSGDSTSSASLGLGNASGKCVFDTCVAYCRGSGSSGLISLLGGTFKNCTFRLSNANHYTSLGTNTYIENGSWHASGTTPTFAFLGGGGFALVSGMDFSNLGSTVDLCRASNTTTAGKVIFRNCKLPSSWSGNLLNTGTVSPAFRAEMYNCDSGDTNYRLWVEDSAGSAKHDTGVYNSAGATDGTTRISWKLVSSANAEYPAVVFYSPEIVRWNETTGSDITVTIEVVLDSATALNNDDCWLEVQYLGTSGFPISSFITDCKANVLATAAAQTSSSATWTGTGGFTNEQKRNLAVTFTPQEKGYIHAVVCLAKPGTTVYVDPLLTVA